MVINCTSSGKKHDEPYNYDRVPPESSPNFTIILQWEVKMEPSGKMYYAQETPDESWTFSSVPFSGNILK